MARQSQSGLELTFHKPSKRWKKVVDGRTRYFGPGKSRRDMPSDRRALQAYREFMDGQHKKDLVAAARGETSQLLGDLTVSEFLAGASPRRRRTRPSSQKNAQSDIAVLVNRSCEQRERETVSRGDGVRPSLTPGSLVDIRKGLKTFVEFATAKPWGEPHANEALIAAYREHLDAKLRSGDYKAHTINDKTKHLRTFMKWLYRRRLIIETPRNLDDVCRKVATVKKGKPLTREQIHQLWDHANPSMRCFIALGLNCGFYSKCISDLVLRNITAAPGYVARHRVKVDVPSKHKLWPVTQQLIEQCRVHGDDPPDQPLFLTSNGTVYNSDRWDVIGILFRRLAKSAGVSATFSQLRDTGAEYIEAHSRKLKPYDPSLTQLYLSHRDDRTARYSLSNDPAVMDLPALDHALDEMQKAFGLKLSQ